MRIVFTGGGTGGHVFPIIAVIRELKNYFSSSPSSILKDKTLEMFFIGPEDSFSKELLEKEGVIVKTITAGKVRRYFTPKDFSKNISDLFFKTPAGILKSLKYLIQIRPGLIFSKGGYGSLPVVMAAKFLKIPIIVHESDTVPGLSNKAALKFAKVILTAFPAENTEMSPEFRSKTICVGNPLRPELLGGNKQEGIKIFNITQKKPILLILGGSQGAQRINHAVLEALKNIVELFEIVHQCGKDNEKELQDQAKLIFEKNPEMKKYYHLFGFLNEEQLKHAFKISNLVISRAGAGTIFEILANRLPSILIPLPEAAQQHQLKNAYYVQDREAGIVIQESVLTPNYLIEKLRTLFSHADDFKAMAQKAKDLAKPDSAKTVAKIIIDFIQKS